MKSQCLALLLSLTTLTAWAGNEGPQAAPTAPSQVIAEIVIGGGLGGPGMPWSTTVDIMKDGRVVEAQMYSRTQTVLTDLATLSPETLAKINALVQSTKVGNIVDPDPTTPSCMDAPATEYFAILASGQRIKIGAIENCKKMIKDNASWSEEQLQKVLDGLIELAHLG